jgi:type IV pilus assembly protein PilQ
MILREHGGEASIMADAQTRTCRSPWRGTRRWEALAVGLLLVGCASSPPGGVQQASIASPPASAAATATAPLEITRLEAREGAPGTLLDVVASGPLVWTSYRDADGNLVIELPNTAPAPGMEGLSSAEGLLARVDVAREGEPERPLTRLTVVGRGDFEYTLSSEDRVLQLRMTPRGGALAEAPAEPLPEEPLPAATEPAAPPEPAPTPPAMEPAAAPAVALGTPDNPVDGPSPTGVLASRLQAVDVLAADGGVAVVVTGDGQFAYSTFRLENPERFVLDLRGVINTSSAPSIAIGGEVLDRVRVAQFKPRPEPVSRVVFDLRRAVAPTIEALPDGLRLRFGGAQATSLAQDLGAAPAPPAPAPAPEMPAGVAPEAAEPAMAVSDLDAAPPTPAPPAPPASDVALFEAAEVEPAAAEERPQPVLQSYGSQVVGGGSKVYTGEPISFSLKDADIKDVLRSFAEISDLNIIVQPGVRGTVTVELESVPWDQALEQILKINGLGMELEGNILRIAPVAQLRAEAEEEQRLKAAQALSIPLRTVMKRLSYATAGDVARILQARRGEASLMSQRGSVIVDARTNTLLIKELPNYIDTVIAVIENLDTPEPQVMIEARIIETTKRFSRSLGIAWGFQGVSDAQHGNTTGLVFPAQGTVDGGANLLTGGRTGFLDVTLCNIDTFSIDAQLQAAENEGLINILSAPKVATLNNERAEIQSGLQIPIQTVANNTVTVQFVNATLRLQVTPHVTAEGTVLMDINIQKREPQVGLAPVGAQNAPIATKEARTRVIVRDGGTTVIGGIFQINDQDQNNMIPGLWKIPILGNLFRNKTRTEKHDELLIFITPRILR